MITRAAEEDARVVYELLCDTMGRTFDWTEFEGAYQEYIKDPTIYAYVVREGDQVIGCMNVRIMFHLHHMKNVAEIMELATDRQHRYKETDQELVRFAVELAKEHQCDCIEVCTRRTNEKAHRFFERVGFNKSHYKLKMPLEHS